MTPAPAGSGDGEPDPAPAASAWDAFEWGVMRHGFLGLVPPPTELPIALGLPTVVSPDAVVAASTELIASVSDGEISAREAQPVMRLLTAHMRLLAGTRRARRRRRR